MRRRKAENKIVRQKKKENLKVQRSAEWESWKLDGNQSNENRTAGIRMVGW